MDTRTSLQEKSCKELKTVTQKYLASYAKFEELLRIFSSKARQESDRSRLDVMTLNFKANLSNLKTLQDELAHFQGYSDTEKQEVLEVSEEVLAKALLFILDLPYDIEKLEIAKAQNYKFEDSL